MLHGLRRNSLHKSDPNKHNNNSSGMDALFAPTDAEDEPSSLVDLSTWRLDARGIALALALLGNRSLARRKLGDLSGALADADRCLRLDNAWLRGYVRKATALRDAGKLSEARAVALSGLDKDPLHAGLGDLVRALDDALLGQQMRERERENEKESERENGRESEREQEPSKGAHKQWMQQQHQRPRASSTASATGIPTRNGIGIGSEDPVAAGGEGRTHNRTGKDKNKGTATPGRRHSQQQQPSSYSDANGSMMMSSSHAHANNNTRHNTTVQLDANTTTIAPGTANSATGSRGVEPQMQKQKQKQMSHRYSSHDPVLTHGQGVRRAVSGGDVVGQ